jgi:hypothetical protein
VSAYNLSEEEAFAAMFEYLKGYWSEFKSANLADVLGDLQPAEHGRSSDPAAWEDWLRCVRAIKAQEGKSALSE